MAHQQEEQQQRTTFSLEDQFVDMMNDFYDTEMNVQSGTFLASSHPRTPPELFGPRNTAMSTITGVPLPAQSISSPPPPPPSWSSLSKSSRMDAGDHHDSTTSTIQEKYRPRTLGPHNMARMSILPIFPPAPVTITRTMAAAAAAAGPSTPLAVSGKTLHLLLSNVPIESLSKEQYARIHHRAFPPLFQLQMNVNTTTSSSNLVETIEPSSSDSFLLGFYQDLYVKMKKRLKVDISVIDFNLTRLCHCIDRVITQGHLEQTMLNIDELGIALEFYMQIDVDMFFLKTCSFNGVEPRLFHNRYHEGLFCIDTPKARFAITPCHKRQCLCCHPKFAQEAMVTFSFPHIHRFVNRYEAILNCPATCQTTNCIYVLTCPCGRFDFIGESTVPFAETLALHREEGNRIIREFFIGEVNIKRTTLGLKSEKKKVNDKLWLYQHSTRCPVAIQLFLDYNPDYWCFAPMKLIYADMSRSRRTTTNNETSSLSNWPTAWTRNDDEVRFLIGDVPKPPLGYGFALYQLQQQENFFKWAKDRIVPADNVDLYNADIVAVLPGNSTKLFRKLIESLFITHAECQLNETGHLVGTNSDPNRTLHDVWCADLTRRPL